MAFIVQVVSECALKGKYVAYYNPELDDDDTYELVVVDWPNEARKFATVSEALEYLSQECPNPPQIWRDQRLEYRPLIVSLNVRFLEV